MVNKKIIYCTGEVDRVLTDEGANQFRHFARRVFIIAGFQRGNLNLNAQRRRSVRGNEFDGSSWRRIFLLTVVWKAAIVKCRISLLVGKVGRIAF